MAAEYSCVFGIAKPLPEVIAGCTYTSFGIDRSGIIFTGKNGVPYFFFAIKLDRKYMEQEIPKYGPRDLEDVIEKFGDFRMHPQYCLKDLYTNRSSASYHALEEAINSVWTYRRFVCLGDSIHKMTPNVSA